MKRTPTPSAYIVAFISRVSFSFGFRKVFWKLNPTSSFTVKGLLPDEDLAKAIAWLLNCKLSVFLVIDIVGFVLKLPSSLNFASGPSNQR